MSAGLSWKAPRKSPAFKDGEAKQVDVRVEVRARFLKNKKDDPALYKTRLVAARTGDERNATFEEATEQGWLRFLFTAVEEGWFTLHVHRVAKGDDIEARSKRDILVACVPEEKSQTERVELLNRKRAWSGFSVRFLGDLASRCVCTIKHPDGSTQEHVADDRGEVWLEGFEGEVFVLTKVISPEGAKE